MIVFAVDGHLLFQVVWVSLVAGIGISALFSLVIYGADKATDHRRAGHAAVATAYTTLAVLAFALFAAGVVLGVETMLDK
jgi:hypothetical protein